jgi:DNA helicase-2/ATP-dependent DNA helicase PcrA
MRLIADLHIHSRFSRATSRDLDLPALHRAAREKGLGVLGTGDCTHPGWLDEIAKQLEPAEDGLLRLRPDLARQAAEGLPAACGGEVRFVLQAEISGIYKRGGRVRKVHSLVYLPSLEAARRFAGKLARIGNLASDGRPILGLDARDLLEIVLGIDPLAFLVPAHVWTPWFSLLGSKSGFDSVEECFGDLASFVFAAETGLSADPAMCRRVSRLDRLTLISSSDAHSPGKLGREATLLDIEPGFEPLRRAIEAGTAEAGFLGTLEFHPEEGKYHLDGHRACGVRLEPGETRGLGGRCPVCGKPITVGVLSRVLDLADREEGKRPGGDPPFESLVPLDEVAGQSLGVGPATKRVRRLVEVLLERVGPELYCLRQAPIEDLSLAGGPLLAEAVRRVREGELTVEGGFDGQYGTVRIFEPGEISAKSR